MKVIRSHFCSSGLFCHEKIKDLKYTGCPRKKVTDLIMASAKDLA